MKHLHIYIYFFLSLLWNTHVFAACYVNTTNDIPSPYLIDISVIDDNFHLQETAFTRSNHEHTVQTFMHLIKEWRDQLKESQPPYALPQAYSTNAFIHQQATFKYYCREKESFQSFLAHNKEYTQLIAQLAWATAFNDFNSSAHLLPLYLDFLLDYFQPPLQAVDLIHWIPSCTVKNQDLFNALRSSFLDDNLANPSLPFFTTSYFFDQVHHDDTFLKSPISLLEQCSNLHSTKIAYYTCLANALDVLEYKRKNIPFNKVFYSLPHIFHSKLKYLTTEYLGSPYDPNEVNNPMHIHKLEHKPPKVPKKEWKSSNNTFYYDRTSKLYQNNKGFIGDTASAIHVNLLSSCSLYNKNTAMHAIGLFSEQRTFYFCGYDPTYGAIWTTTHFDAAILGNTVATQAGTRFINTYQQKQKNEQISIPFVLQGGLPVFQISLHDLSDIRLNGCLDSGSIQSYRTPRFRQRFPNYSSTLQLIFYKNNVLLKPLSTGKSQDALLHCDIILGADFLTQFSEVLFTHKYLLFGFSRSS